MSHIDFDGLREDFVKRLKSNTDPILEICRVVESLLHPFPLRKDLQRKYYHILKNHTRKQCALEETFDRLVEFGKSLEPEPVPNEEGLTLDETILFQVLLKENITQSDREQLKLASRNIWARVVEHFKSVPRFSAGDQIRTKRHFIFDTLHDLLPRPMFTEGDIGELAARVYRFVGARFP